MKHRVFLAVTIMFVLATNAVAQNYDFSAVAPTGQTLYYRITSGGTVSVVNPGYLMSTGDSLAIPNNVTHDTIYSVTAIGDSTFRHCYGLTSVTIPNSVITIGKSAFFNCYELTSVTIGNSLTTIGESAFSECRGLTGALTIPNSVTTIGGSAFHNCSGLTSVTIGNSVTTIGNTAFSNCSGLTGTLTIPNTVTAIGYSAFHNCSGLTSVIIGDSVTSIGDFAFFNCSGLTSVTIGDSVTSIGINAFSWCSSLTGALTIPNSVAYIGDGAFYGCNGLTSVTIGNSVASIGSGAFGDCSSLISVTIGKSATSIGDEAFTGCSGLTSVLFNADSCVSVGSRFHPIFSGCSNLTSIIFGNNVKRIPSFLSYGLSGLTSVTIPNSVTTIGESAFYNCSGLTSVTIGNSLTTIGESAFSECRGLTGALTIPNSVTTIGGSAFYNCSGLTSVVFNADSCVLAGYHNNTVFFGCCNITSITFGNNVKRIPDYLCSGLSGLTSLTIPQKVSYIGMCAFENCIGLISVAYNADSCVSAGISSYNTAFSGCSNLTNITFGDNVKRVPDYLCYGLTGLTSLNLPRSVTSIGNSAFDGCRGIIGSLVIPNSVTIIGDNAFAYCSRFTGSLTIPNSVTTIGNSAFNNCSGFTGTLTIPNTVTTIGNFAFYNCSGLTGKLTIPNSVTTIGGLAFYNCSGFTGSLTIPNSVTTIGYGAFEGCSGLTGALTIPNSVNTIGECAFSGCCGLTGALIIPSSVTTIGRFSFSSCSGFSAVNIPGSVDTIGDYAFQSCTGITSFTSLATVPPRLGNHVFYIFPTTLQINVPCGSAASYRAANGWSDFRNIREVEASAIIPCSTDLLLEYDVDCGAAGASVVRYYGTCAGPLSIPDSIWCNGTAYPIVAIGDGVFANCRRLTSLTLGNSMQRIGDRAFYYCDSIEGSFTIPNSVTSIGSSAFGNCTGLTLVEFNADSCALAGSSSSPAFNDCSNLANITFGNNVKRIPNYLCYSLSGLNSVVIPNSVKVIGNYAFRNCSNLTSLTIGNSVDTIASYAFYSCNKLSYIVSNAVVPPVLGISVFSASTTTPVYVPCGSEASYRAATRWNRFTGIQDAVAMLDLPCSTGQHLIYALNCNMTGAAIVGCSGACTGTLAIPDSIQYNGRTYPVVAIGNRAFYSCSGLAGALTIPNTVTFIGDYSFYQCGGLTSLTIGNHVDTIGANAFYGCSGFTGSLSIPNAITYIGDYAFRGCSGFTGSLSIPNLVTHIGNYAFYGCSGFTGSLVIPNSVTSIGHYAFYQCGITSLSLGNAVTSIGNGAFSRCNGLTTISVADGNTVYDSRNNCNAIIETATNTLVCGCKNTSIPNTVTSIGNYAFYYCSELMGELYIPNSVVSIGDRAFYYCNDITSIDIPSSVTSIGNYAFYYCSGLTSIAIPSSVTSIGGSAFYGCSGLASIAIPDSVTSIGTYTFYNCSGLASLTFGRSVTSIGNYALSGCSNLASITSFATDPPAIGGTYTFRNVPSTTPVYVPCQSAAAYSAATGWSGFSDIRELPVHVDTTITACNSYTWHNRVFTESTDTATYRTTNDAGCDSIVTLNLTVNGCNTFIADGNWNDGTKWSTGEVPGSGDDVLVVADATIPDGCTAHVNSISIDGGSITIADGGQLLATNSVPVTVQKGIGAATWHAIAAPVNNNNITPLTSGSYDLFAYDEEQGTWLNQKVHGDFALGRGQGYIYRRAAATTVSFEGNTTVGNIGGRPLSWLCADGGLKGFNLVGNPYPHNIYLGTGLQTTGCAASYYTLQRDGTWRVATNSPIAVGQAVLMQASGNDATVSFVDDANAPAAKSAPSWLTFTVSDGRHEDVAVATFGEGAGLRKVSHLNAEAPMLYIPQEDADYAVAMVGDNVEEFPLHLRTAARGQYTLNVAGAVPGMQIIDLQTGRNVATPYSFEGGGTARFLVRLRPYDGDRPFAFQNGGNVVVAGEGTLQAYDIMGRLLFSSEVISRLSIPSSKFPATGVYLLRLGGKSQKIVIK